MTVRRWWLLGVAVVLVLSLSIYWFVHQIGQDFAARHDDRVGYALKHTALKKVKNVVSFVSDKHYTVISGTDRNDAKLIVWLAKGYIRERYADEGVSAAFAKQQLYAAEKQARALRVVPGVIEQELVWEIYYVVRHEGAEQYGYKYYRFVDGSEMRNVRLPRQTKVD